MNKYLYLNVLQGRYGQGWEDLTASEKYSEIKQDLIAYRKNEGGTYRIIKRREVNPEHNKTIVCINTVHQLCSKCGLNINESQNGWHYETSDLKALNVNEAYALWSNYNQGNLQDLKQLTNSILVNTNQMKF